MGILPMKYHARAGVSSLLPLSFFARKKKQKKPQNMGKMPMGLMAKRAMLQKTLPSGRKMVRFAARYA